MRSLALLLVPVAVAACDSGTRVSPPPATGAPAASAPATSAPTASAAPPPAAPGVTITNLAPGEPEITATGPVKLASVARIETQVAGAWSALPELDLGKGYRLVERCGGAEPPACIELAPGAVLRPAPFRGFTCSSQCNESCRANAWVGPGTFRVVVSTCDGATIAGPPFQLPGADHASSLGRWGLASDVAKVSAMRLEKPRPGWNATAPAVPDKVAGFGVRAGTERQLEEPEIASLLDRLRAADGFDDRVAKRCAMGTLVGFRVTRRPASTGERPEDVVEIAIDFTCQKLFAVRGGDRGRARTVYATHFDPSRAAFLSLARRALVDDTELAKLR